MGSLKENARFAAIEKKIAEKKALAAQKAAERKELKAKQKAQKETEGQQREKQPKEKKPKEKQPKEKQPKEGSSKFSAKKLFAPLAALKDKLPKKKEPQKRGKYVPVFSIRNKIILCFMIPIGFMALVGYVAYGRAADGMSQKYQDATMETLQMGSQYIETTAAFIKTEGARHAYDKTLTQYVQGLYDGDAINKAKIKENINSTLLSSQSMNAFIKNIHVVTPANVNMFSTMSNLPQEGILDAYREEFKNPENERQVIAWTDAHPSLDEIYSIKEKDAYILSYQVMSSSNNYVVVIDVAKEAMQTFVDDIDLGEGSVVGLVTPNGNELIHEMLPEGAESAYAEGEKVFAQQSFFTDALASVTEEKTAGSMEVRYNGQKYLFFYAKNLTTDVTMCALVPMIIVTSQADSIRSMTIILVILATVFVMIFGLIIVFGIQGNMKTISGKFGEVANGDLTVHVYATGHDEFQNLAGSATHMIRNTKKLVVKVSDATETLEESAQSVSDASAVLADYSQEITGAISDINSGMERQSRHAQQCVDTTDSLSREITEMVETVEQVKLLVEQTSDMIRQGMDIVRVLGDRAQETTKVTNMVAGSIEELRKDSESINSFVGMITDISFQTNLLSLNASIEAARAGEAGRGFSVVAEEIRKLADDSAKAAGQIKKQVVQIGERTQQSVQSANDAEQMVSLQTEAVNQAVEVFEQMQQRMDALVAGLQSIADATERADSVREDTVEAVRSISEIIEETAENTETVMGVADKLQENVDNLNGTANRLNEDMQGMKSEIDAFKI